MSPAKVNILGLTQKSLLGTTWRMAESSPTISAGDRAWILGCRHGLCSGKDNHTRVRRGGGGGQQYTRMRTAYLLPFLIDRIATSNSSAIKCLRLRRQLPELGLRLIDSNFPVLGLRPPLSCVYVAPLPAGSIRSLLKAQSPRRPSSMSLDSHQLH